MIVVGYQVIHAVVSACRVANANSATIAGYEVSRCRLEPPLGLGHDAHGIFAAYTQRAGRLKVHRATETEQDKGILAVGKCDVQPVKT